MYNRASFIEHQRPLVFNQIAINLELFTKLRFLHLNICDAYPSLTQTYIPFDRCIEDLVARSFFVPYSYDSLHRQGAPLDLIFGHQYYERVANGFKVLTKDGDSDLYRSFSKDIAYSQEIDCLKS